MSGNGTACLLGKCPDTSYNLTEPIKPLQCGKMHKLFYGTTGYDVPGHWCNLGNQVL